jgi:murein DD-endopeptidase MepM/ murein hydrolase activator NlpD
VKRKRSCRPGLAVTKGQVIGRVGDVYENGGWNAPHVHFQLSMNPPDQPHDMPGASSVEDRPKALLQYPDPRYVLGPIY